MNPKGADLLRMARRIRGFTQEEVASAYGISTKTYRNWERGNTSVSYDDLFAICGQVFHLPMAKIIEAVNDAA